MFLLYYKIILLFSVFVRQNASTCNFSFESLVILSPVEQRIKQKIEAVGTPLKEWDINIYRGVLTGYNEAFIIDGTTKEKLIAEDPKNEEIIRPILRGRDIKRYGYEFADLWLINTHNGIKEKGIKPININDYPVIKKHLDKFYPELEKRQDKGETPYNLRNCAYIEDFYRQKIVYSETNNADETKVGFDEKGEYFTDKTCFILLSKNETITKHIYKLMSFKIFTWYMKVTSPLLGSQGISLTKETVETFPACPIGKDYDLIEDEIQFIENQ